MAGFGVYLHVPFCAARCDYCAFATWTDRHHLADAYLAALQRDIERSVDIGMPPATSVFVGGGTPTMVDAERLAEVIAAIPTTAGGEVGPEVTVECNPDDVTVELLRAYRSAGVNRISIGVQSMAPHVLAALGRWHEPDNVAAAVAAIADVGFDSFNLDLIFGVAGETLDDLHATLDAVLAFDPPHIAAYGLQVEPGTPLAADASRHPDDDDQADKYLQLDRRLAGAGLDNYEISNWARPGHESRHNQLYWAQGDYRGFGSAAHSHESGRRWWNVRTPERYIDAVERNVPTEAAGETLDEATRDFEGLELKLRTNEGVPAAALDGHSTDLVGFVERVERPDGDRWVLTPEGRLIANEVSVRLDTDRHKPPA